MIKLIPTLYNPQINLIQISILNTNFHSINLDIVQRFKNKVLPPISPPTVNPIYHLRSIAWAKA